MKTIISGKRTLPLVIGISAVLVSVLGVALWKLTGSGKAPPPVPLQAFFVSPVQHAAYPVGTPVPVRAVVRGQEPLERAELWADGVKTETHALDRASSDLINWRYTPQSEGDHSLTVKVLDSKGRVTESQVLDLEATAAVTYTAQVPAAAGESLGEVAKRFGSTETETAAVNPGLQTGKPLGAGILVSIPIITGIASGVGEQSSSPGTPQSAPIAEPGAVMVPVNVSGAYFYATKDGQSWYRVPEEEGSMLSPQGTDLILPLAVLPSFGHDDPDASPTFQTWGWQAGKLQELGTVNAALPNPTTLDVCNSPWDCYGDMGGSWVKETSVPDSGDDRARKLWWYNPDPQVDQAIMQVSLFPFSDTTAPSGVYEKKIEAKGQFSVDFAGVFEADPEGGFLPSAQLKFSQTGEASTDTTGIQALAKFQNSALWKNNLATWYLRVIPLNAGQIAGDPSPQVIVHQIPTVAGEEVNFYSPPSIYDVEIKDFQPIHFPEAGVCQGAMILDTAYTIDQMGQTATLFPAGTVLCPAPYKGIGEQSWYESLWDFVSSGVSWVSEAYNTLKSSIVNAVGGLVCGGNAECTAALAAGLDIGMVALGIPPTLPNFDQLMSEGLNYVAATLAEQAGCPDVACKELIKQGLEEAIESTKNTNPGCMDAGQAHNEGLEPLCLPEGVTAHPDPRALHSSAVATVEIRRNSTPITDQGGYEMFKDSYLLSVGFTATNAGPVGRKIINIPPYDESMIITEPLDAAVFRSVSAPIPPLQPGESVTLPFSLVATEYWIPGHKELMYGWTTVEYRDGWPQYYYDDWWKLYWGGTIEIYASITACDPGIMSSCLISTDSSGQIQIPTTAGGK